jgi:4-amino-4-deoxy-L-arabinose transferase-like glycosyltransferase
MPLYYVFRGNAAAFSFAFRALNGAFLVATLYTLYLIVSSLFGEKKGLRLALYFAVLPSVAIANGYSNDIVALLPAALAIYMMVKKKALLCGLLLGLATLGKGFPLLLLIPALMAFNTAKDRVKLVGVTLMTLVFASLPFMLINPFTYVSTFTHVSSRGPWETVWAFMNGYYSHGGLLHPYFDKFFYHFNLLKIYPATPYDQAIYEWRLGFMPDLLTMLQIAVVAMLSLAYMKRENKIVPLCGLLYIGYMLFFKGYSTQFAVSTPFYVLLAAMDSPLLFLIPLEVSHILQMLSWGVLVNPEAVRNWHLPFLESAVVIRTAVFAILVLNAFRSTHLSFKQIAKPMQQFLGGLRVFKDKKIILLVSVTVLTATISFGFLYGYTNNNSSAFRIYDGYLNLTQSEWNGMKVNGLERGDQVMVRLNTNVWVDAKAISDNATVQVERGVVNPFNLKGSFNETMLFFEAESDSYDLMLRMKHPAMPFRVTDGLDSDLEVNATSNGSTLTLKLHDEGVDGNSSLFRMAYPCESYVGDDFRLHLKYELIDGNLSGVQLDVLDDTDEWMYTFNASEDFVLTPATKDLYGYSNLLHDKISLVRVAVLLENNSSATVRLDELSIEGSESSNVGFYAYPGEEVHCEMFIERDFKPSISYATALISTIALGTIVVYNLYRKVESVRDR